MAENTESEQGNTESAQVDTQAEASGNEEQLTLLGGSGADTEEGGSEEAKAAEGEEGAGDDGDGDGGDSDAGAESYEAFELPEGMEMDEAALAEVTELFKADGLSQDQAQKYVDLMANKMQADAEAADAAHQETVQGWLKEAKQDGEIGGQNWGQTETLALKGMDAVATPELREFFDVTGLGNHPEMIRVFATIGKLASEPSLFGSPAGGKAAPSAAQKMYPNLK